MELAFFFGDAMSLVLRSQLSPFEPGPFTPRDRIPMGSAQVSEGGRVRLRTQCLVTH